jgi:Cu/Ag efflux protein CusF
MAEIQKCSSLLAALGMALCVSGAGASSLAESAHGVRMAAEPHGLFHGVGVVIAVDPKTGALTVNHSEIRGFMPAMEMMFRVDPPSLSQGLRKGDKIAFTIEGPGGVIRAVTLIKQAE